MAKKRTMAKVPIVNHSDPHIANLMIEIDHGHHITIKGKEKAKGKT